MNHPGGWFLNKKNQNRGAFFLPTVITSQASVQKIKCPHVKHKSAVHFAQYKSIMEIDKDCVRCPVCASRQPRIIRRPIFFHHQPDKNEGKWQNDADSDDDGVPDPCSAESSDSDDCEETDAESSDDEDDDELHHSKSDDDCDFLNDNQQKFMRKIKLAVASQIREAFGEMQVITINKYIEKIIENMYSHVCYHLLFCLTFQRA